MINHISLANFRAFKNAEIPLSKLNIFVGPNNSGKSSIISAVNLIAQNLKAGTKEYTLALNGPYVELGTFYDTVHGHTAKSVMSIGFVVDEYKYNYSYRYRPQKREIELIKAEMTGDGFRYQYTFGDSGVSQLVSSPEHKIQGFRPVQRSRVYGFNISHPLFQMTYRRVADEFGLETYKSLRNFLFKTSSNLERQFIRFDSVGAFRTAPQRIYQYTGEAPNAVGRDGDKSAQMLASSAASRSKSRTSVIRSVSQWFKESGAAKNLKIKSLTNRHFEITVEDQAGHVSNITDSGFGCSQALPVLAAGFNLISSKRTSLPAIFVVQEPEIHLHPSAAAHMGTYFSELANNNVQCFVETHSENIILRIAHHVASGDLLAEDVNIYWVSANSGEHTITPLPLSEDGTFTEKWPEGFFPTRSEETLNLARAATNKRDILSEALD